MPKEISSDVNFIIALINELDDLYESSNQLLSEISNEYDGYLLLIRAKKHFLDTFTEKIFDAFTIINKAIIKVTTRIRTSKEGITILEVRDRVNREIQEAIRNNLANKNFVNMILKEYTITSLLEIKTRKKALEKFQQNELIADQMLDKFKSIITETRMKFYDGGPPNLRPGNKLIIQMEKKLKEVQKKKKLFTDSKNKPDMEDLALSAEFLCHNEHSRRRSMDFVTSDGPLKKSLKYIRKSWVLIFNIWFVDRKQFTKITDND